METRAAAERNNVDSPSANPDDAGNPVISAAPLRRARSYLARRAKAGYELRREEEGQVARSIGRTTNRRSGIRALSAREKRADACAFLYSGMLRKGGSPLRGFLDPRCRVDPKA